MSDTKTQLCGNIFNDLMDIGSEIDDDDDLIQALRDDYAIKGEGMCVVIEITVRSPSARHPDPGVIYTGCFTMMDGYPTKMPIPLNPHVRLRTDLMTLKYILRGYRYYKAPKGRLKVKYGFRRAYGEERLFKEVRQDVHILSDSVLVDKVIPLLEKRIFPIFRKRWKNKWIMKDS